MARDLSFWKVKGDVRLQNQEIYWALSDEEYVEGLEVLPISDILNDFHAVFSDWKADEDNYFEKGDESFELMSTTQFIRCDCYSLSEDNMNKIIEIMLKYDCPLYDSAIDVRFEV